MSLIRVLFLLFVYSVYEGYLAQVLPRWTLVVLKF